MKHLEFPDAWMMSISFVTPLAACWNVRLTTVSWALEPI
jgi:hypothetical protein